MLAMLFRYSFEKFKNLSEAELLELLNSWQDYKPEEILGLVRELENHAPAIDLGRELFDCCGTGGDRTNTFNISTTASFIAASAGVRICKNGGRSTTSTTGSVDVLEALGLNLSAKLETKQEGLKKYGLAFYSSPVSAELLAPVKQVCRKHKITSFLSLLAPLASPARLEGQVLGIGQTKWLRTLKEVQKKLIASGQRTSALLIHSCPDSVQLDELSSATRSKVIEIYQDGTREFDFDPSLIGIKKNKLSEILGGADHKANAQIIKDILSGQAPQAKIDSACLNSSALIYLAQKDKSQDTEEFHAKIKKYYDFSLDAINRGKAKKLLDNLIELYNSQNTV
jgi:anthranilate phosphoribosyltransferase